MKANPIKIVIPTTNSKLFAYTRWDAVPALAGLSHLALFFSLYFLFPRAPLSVMLVLGLLYAFCINANINGVSHNFIHNPFFRSPLLNRLFAVVESVACCFSQTYYDVVHMQHHKGNSDKQDEHGETAGLDFHLSPRPRRRGRKRLELYLLILLPGQPGGDQPRTQEARRGRSPLGQHRVGILHRRPRHHGSLQLALHRLLPAVLLLGALLQAISTGIIGTSAATPTSRWPGE